MRSARFGRLSSIWLLSTPFTFHLCPARALIRGACFCVVRAQEMLDKGYGKKKPAFLKELVPIPTIKYEIKVGAAASVSTLLLLVCCSLATCSRLVRCLLVRGVLAACSLHSACVVVLRG